MSTASLDTILALRTNRFDDVIGKWLERLTKAGMRAVVVADERSGTINTGSFQKASLTAHSMARLHVRPHKNAGWLCGDYALYLAAEAIPEAQSVWLIEPDVRINFEDPADFFASFAASKADLLAAQLSPAAPNWYWTSRMEGIRRPVYRTIFPFLRVSRRAIHYLLQVRQSLFEVKDELYPNDESFLASVLVNDGFDCRAFSDSSDFVPASTFGFARPVSGKALDLRAADKRVYHPVLYGEDYLRKALYLCRTSPMSNHVQDMISGVGFELGEEAARTFAAEASAYLTRDKK